MEKISAALKSTSVKKENLRKAWEAVQSQSHSSTLSTRPVVQWTDLEQHFDSLQSSLQQRFDHLRTKQRQLGIEDVEEEVEESVVRSKLKSFCLNMDGPGLRSFVMDNRKQLPATREDATFALRFAPDPPKLVLDALQGFYPLKSKRDKGGELGAIRRTCVLLLEGLAAVQPQINPQVKKEANKLALDWKRKVSTQSDDQLEALVFLQLLASYGLASEFNVNELLDLLVSIARRRQAIDLFKGLGFRDNISDFIEKLSSKGKHIDAVKFIYAFDMVDKFPPVPLLKAYLEESKKVAQDVLNKGHNSVQSQNEAIAKETAYLRAIVKCIEEHNLEAQYPRDSIEKRIEQLEKQKPEKKRPVTASSQPQQKQFQNEYKRPRVAGLDPDDLANVASLPYHLRRPGLFGEHLSSSAHYSLTGSAPTYPPYMSAAAGSSGVGAGPPNVGANQSSSLSYLHSSQPDMPSSLYDRSKRFGGYGLSEYSSPHFF